MPMEPRELTRVQASLEVLLDPASASSGLHRAPSKTQGPTLNADAELDVLRLIAGVRVEVVRRPAMELVALAQLAAHNDAHRQSGDPGRDQADAVQPGAAMDGMIDPALDLIAESLDGARQLHAMDHIAPP